MHLRITKQFAIGVGAGDGRKDDPIFNPFVITPALVNEYERHVREGFEGWSYSLGFMWGFWWCCIYILRMREINQQ